LETAVIDRAGLAAGPRRGPVIVEEYDATCVVLPGWRASLDASKNVVIERR
jgi:N-methylhydantoinase A